MSIQSVGLSQCRCRRCTLKTAESLRSSWIYNSAISKIKRNHQVREPPCVTDAGVGGALGQQSRLPGASPERFHGPVFLRLAICKVMPTARLVRVGSGHRSEGPAGRSGQARGHVRTPANIRGDTGFPHVAHPYGGYFRPKRTPPGAGGAWAGWWVSARSSLCRERAVLAARW